MHGRVEGALAPVTGSVDQGWCAFAQGQLTLSKSRLASTPTAKPLASHSHTGVKTVDLSNLHYLHSFLHKRSGRPTFGETDHCLALFSSIPLTPSSPLFFLFSSSSCFSFFSSRLPISPRLSYTLLYPSRFTSLEYSECASPNWQANL